jgi:hypothetical protein
VGSRAGLDTEATGEILSPLPEIEPPPPGQTLLLLSHKILHNRIDALNNVPGPWNQSSHVNYKYIVWCQYMLLDKSPNNE